jgi:hypothetical protein
MGGPSTRPPRGDSTLSSLTRVPQRGDGGSSRVYASLPLTGPAGRLAREVLRGAELALERTAYGRYAVSDGELVWDRSGAPRS